MVYMQEKMQVYKTEASFLTCKIHNQTMISGCRKSFLKAVFVLSSKTAR